MKARRKNTCDVALTSARLPPDLNFLPLIVLELQVRRTDSLQHAVAPPVGGRHNNVSGGSGVFILGGHWGGDTFIWGAHN